LNLVIVHYHLRPGGIRRVIELATPHLARQFNGAVESVALACGEANDRKWNAGFQERLSGIRVEFLVEPAFNYLSEQRRSAHAVSQLIRAALAKLFANASAKNCLVWAHNLGIGRNLLLTRELTRVCSARGIPLVAHHHDWWFDNRWQRWLEMRRAGFRTLRAAAWTIFPPASGVRHVAINQADAEILRRHFAKRARWLPNLTEPAPASPPARARVAKNWLDRELADDAPVWLLPCRLLRRKNIAEALLLTRWLRPEAWLVTTGGVSSAQEQAYADRLAAAARQQGWQLRLGILHGNKQGNPDVNDLLAASEVVLLTSIQEGFGLATLEAAEARRPLIARSLPNVAPDLRRFGFRFPQYYAELLIDPRLFDWPTELRRQQRLFNAWKNRLPEVCRPWTGEPDLLAARTTARPVSFSRLTLSAQLEVLAQPLDRSWDLCARLNPFLRTWKRRAAAGRLQITPWPRSAGRWLNGCSYARRFEQIVRAPPQVAPPSDSSIAAQEEFIRARLGSEHLFPLLWSHVEDETSRTHFRHLQHTA
jgi:glycosyltransferase involved in cell wall biosynthesis